MSRRLTDAQTHALAKVNLADRKWREQKFGAPIRIRTLVEAEISAQLVMRDDLVRRAFEAGAPKTRIAEALHTSAVATVDESLARTALEVSA